MLFNFLHAVSFGYLVLFHPTPPLRLHAFVAMHSIMIALGFVGQKKLASAIRVSLKQPGELFNFMLFRLIILVPPYPTPLPLHALKHTVQVPFYILYIGSLLSRYYPF